jgi:hypothetical protein
MYRSPKVTYVIIFATLLLLAPQTAHAQENGRAGLVVVAGEGEAITRCIALDQPSMSGERLLTLSGLDVVSDPQSSMGATVCRIEGVGCNHPAEDCFCKCKGASCTYWSYWRLSESGEWGYSSQGATGSKVTSGTVEGWVWGDGSSGEAPEPPALTFAAICAPEPLAGQRDGLSATGATTISASVNTTTTTTSAITTAAISVVTPRSATKIDAVPTASTTSVALEGEGGSSWQAIAGVAAVVALPLVLVLFLRRRKSQ